MTIHDRVAIARAVTGGARVALRGRALLAVAAIALGVALGYAVELINRAAIDELAGGLALMSGQADLEVRGPRGGFDEEAFSVLARDRDVAVASPVVEVDVKLRGRTDPLPVLGVDVFRAVAINPALVAVTRNRLDALRQDTLFASDAALRWMRADVGDAVVAQAGLAEFTLRIAGRAGSSGGLRYAIMDIAAVQDRFDRAGRITRIDLRLRPGADVSAAQRRIEGLLPAGVHAAAPAAGIDAATRYSRAYRVNLNVLALVALFTGAMLVYATQTLAVVRRRPQFALLRTLGLTRGQLLRWIVGEAVLQGSIGGVIGLAAGYAIATGALRVFGPDLGAGFFSARAAVPSVDALSLLVFDALGIAAAVAGSVTPAREAASVAPAVALKASDADLVVAPHATLVAMVAIAAGTAAAFLPAVGELPIFGYAAIALILIGGILAMPALAQRALVLLDAPRRPGAALALAHLRATPGRFVATLATVVASVALMVAMAIMVASFRQSLDDWLSAMLPADVYLRAGADSAYFSTADEEAIAALRGVARAEFLRTTSVSLDPGRARVVLLARDVDPRNADHRLALVGPSFAPAPDAPPPAWISEAVADLQSLRPGGQITLPIAGRNVAFTVAGVWRDYARQQGAVVIERARYRELTGDATVNEAALWRSPATSIAELRDAIASFAGDRLQVATPGELRRLSLATFDRTFAVTYALEAAAIVIGLAGLSASLVAQTLARRRELGMLRHLGMTRRQIGSMLATEGATLAAFGVAAGLMLGVAISLVLVHVVNRQSFHWGMDVHIPWSSLTLLASVLLALATLTARIAARGATGTDAIRAVRDDW